MGSPGSPIMEHKNVFVEKYHNISLELRTLFCNLRDKVKEVIPNCQIRYTDRPDFRFVHKYVFCHVDFLIRPERLRLRIKYYYDNTRKREYNDNHEMIPGDNIQMGVEKILKAYQYYMNSL